jgi:hypothetical protein
MDNGPLQQAMVEQLKQEVKDQAVLRRTLGYMREAEATAGQIPAQDLGSHHANTPQHQIPFRSSTSSLSGATQPAVNDARHGNDNRSTHSNLTGSRVAPGCDPGFMSYYLDFFFPFLFPFYQPHMLEGGRAWLLEFMNEAEGMQQVTLALSAYLFSIVLDATEAGHQQCIKIGWDKLFSEMRNAFERLRDDIPKLSRGSKDVTQLSQAIRVLGVMIHLERFEIATQGFANCNKHLGAAVQCFKEILNWTLADANLDFGTRFFTVMTQLGPSPWPKPHRQFHFPSSDQVAFRFIVSLLIADDIIASTSLGGKPRLYEYHASLLSVMPEREAPIDLGAVMGCQNWVMLHISEISALAVLKRQEGDSEEVIRRYNLIEKALSNRLVLLEAEEDESSALITSNEETVLNLFRGWQREPSTPVSQYRIVTRLWAHAAMIYLDVTLNGCNPTGAKVAQQVEHMIDLISHRLTTPALIRSIVWPFCVAGCLAVPKQESFFRHQVETLQPSGLFGTARKAIEIMESVWQRRAESESADDSFQDMASCFKATGEVIFLI